MNVASKYAFHDPEVLKRVAAELQKQGRKFSTDPRLGEFADAKKCPGRRPSCTARSNAPCTICRFFSEGWSAVRSRQEQLLLAVWLFAVLRVRLEALLIEGWTIWEATVTSGNKRIDIVVGVRRADGGVLYYLIEVDEDGHPGQHESDTEKAEEAIRQVERLHKGYLLQVHYLHWNPRLPGANLLASCQYVIGKVLATCQDFIDGKPPAVAADQRRPAGTARFQPPWLLFVNYYQFPGGACNRNITTMKTRLLKNFPLFFTTARLRRWAGPKALGLKAAEPIV